jgi:hypothetical protein
VRHDCIGGIEELELAERQATDFGRRIEGEVGGGIYVPVRINGRWP